MNICFNAPTLLNISIKKVHFPLFEVITSTAGGQRALCVCVSHLRQPCVAPCLDRICGPHTHTCLAQSPHGPLHRKGSQEEHREGKKTTAGKKKQSAISVPIRDLTQPEESRYFLSQERCCPCPAPPCTWQGPGYQSLVFIQRAVSMTAGRPAFTPLACATAPLLTPIPQPLPTEVYPRMKTPCQGPVRAGDGY